MCTLCLVKKRLSKHMLNHFIPSSLSLCLTTHICTWTHTHRHIQLPHLISPRPHTSIQGTGCGMPCCLPQYKGQRGQRRIDPELQHDSYYSHCATLHHTVLPTTITPPHTAAAMAYSLLRALRGFFNEILDGFGTNNFVTICWAYYCALHSHFENHS